MSDFNKDQQKILDMASSYAHTFGGDEGLKVLGDMVESYDKECFVDEDPGGRKTAYNEGRRSVILDIRYMLEVNANPNLLKGEEVEDGTN